MSKKNIIIVSIIVLVVAAGWLGWRYLYPSYQMWRLGEGVKKFEREFTALLKNDTFGGQTSEETYNLYVAALKRGDTDSASKYFYWERQVAQKEKLDGLKAKGELDKYAADLPGWGEMREEDREAEDTRRFSWKENLKESTVVKIPDGAGGEIEYNFEPGEYKQDINFWLNKQANIWKIFNL